MTNVTTKLNVRFNWETTHAKKDSRHVHILSHWKSMIKRYFYQLKLCNDIINLFILGKHKTIYSSIIVHICSIQMSYARTAEGWYEFDDALVSFLIQYQYYEISC